jgi:hypothetical protein
MFTEKYIFALYYFAYGVIGLAGQDNIRNTMMNWWEYQIGADVFHDNVCRALSADTKAKQVYGF